MKDKKELKITEYNVLGWFENPAKKSPEQKEVIPLSEDRPLPLRPSPVRIQRSTILEDFKKYNDNLHKVIMKPIPEEPDEYEQHENSSIQLNQ